MSTKLRRRPSAAFAISLLALVLAASGSAVAASKLMRGDSLIKKASLSGNRLKNGTITGKQINLSTLGKVPSAAMADTATSATTATTAGSAPISTVTYVTVSGQAAGPNTYVNLTANCPTGTTVLGGGGSVSVQANDYVNDSHPNGKTGWTADFAGTLGDAVSVYAICAPAATTAP